MLIQLSLRFWLCFVIIFVAIRLRWARPATWFGLLNLGALATILGWRNVALIAALSLLFWLGLAEARKVSDDRRANAMFLLIVTAIGALLIWQKALFEVSSPTAISSLAALQAQRFLVLIAFSYVALRAWDVVAAVRSGERLLNPLALSGYLVPFFMMPAGPINVYADHVKVDDRPGFPSLTWTELLSGTEVLVFGLFMKFVLGELLRLFVVGSTGLWPTHTFSDCAIIYLYIYLDFAGYSLITVGIGRLLKVPTPTNFNQPMFASSLTDFWTRWHMSLSAWIRRNIYFPFQLFLLRKMDGKRPYLINTISLMAGFTFVGLWHRFTVPFFIWGVLFGIFLAIEKFVRDYAIIPYLKSRPLLTKVARVIGPIYVLGVVIGLMHFTAIAQMVSISP